MPFKYTAYGLTFESELECPDLRMGETTPEVHVFIRELPSSADILKRNGRRFIVTPNFFFIDIQGVARFQVNRGAEILIDPAPEAIMGDVRLYLLGSVFAALIQQRGELALHASAVMKNGRAILFAGESGAGKSTTALSFLSRPEWSLCADDVCRLTHINGETHIYPAYPSMKIWKEVADVMDIPRARLTSIDKQPGKHRMPIECVFPTDPIPVAHIFRLTQGASYTAPQAITGSHKLILIRQLLYRTEFLKEITSEEKIFPLLSTLLKNTPVSQVTRPNEQIRRSALDTQSHTIGSYFERYKA